MEALARVLFTAAFLFGAVGMFKIAEWLYTYIPGGYLILGAVIFTAAGIIFQYQADKI